MKTMMGDGDFNSSPNVSKQLSYVGLATAVILLVPLVAMQFTNQVVWTFFDFVAAAVLLGGTGSAFVLLARKVRTARSRTILGMVLAALLLSVWAELAVGIIGTFPFSGS